MQNSKYSSIKETMFKKQKTDDEHDLEIENREKKLQRIASLEEKEYSEDDTSDEENPEPEWNIPNWKGNSKQTHPVLVCSGCVTRVSKTLGNIGCEQCDEYWDMPELEPGLSEEEIEELIQQQNAYEEENTL
jgi:hypothetical protein